MIICELDSNLVLLFDLHFAALEEIRLRKIKNDWLEKFEEIYPDYPGCNYDVLKSSAGLIYALPNRGPYHPELVFRYWRMNGYQNNFEIIIDGFAKIKASEFHFDQGLFKGSRTSLRLFKRDIEKKDFYQSNTKSNKFSAKFKIGK